MEMPEKESKWFYLYMIAALLIASLPALVVLALVFGFVFGASIWAVLSLVANWFIPLVLVGVGLWLYPKITGGKTENWWMGVGTIVGLLLVAFWVNGNLNQNGYFYHILVSLFGGGASV
jgi:hypothetical protein